MTVYVDNMRAPIGSMIMCQMIADTDEELHAMAKKIGIARKWHKAPPMHDSHYYLGLAKRELAIKKGAKVITMRELSYRVVFRRQYGRMPSESEVHSWHRMRSEMISK